MPPSPITAKIEELRFRLKTDPKSRLFYPLAEELRKIGLCDDAEQVLRTGLTYHPSYLSAWVSLGRVSREQGKSDDAIEALSKALQLDPGNVVAARLLADSYLAAGEKVEAIKKYKLVHALMPSDSDVEATIAQLERELTPIAVAAPEPEPEPYFVTPSVSEGPGGAGGAPPEPPGPSLTLGVTPEISSAEEAILAADEEPMLAAHDESPFEEPVEDFTAAAVEIDAPAGIHIEEADEQADVFAPTEEEPPAAAPPAAAAEPTDTVTMADLYARQGLVADARRIYEAILQRDPDNDAVREKLAALGGGEALMPVQEKVARLEGWLAKMGKREESHV
jgi:tetratricopeptide (TPR) repeat protein